MDKDSIKQVLDICSRQEDVKKDVFKNHDNNMWWPREIKDYRKRLLIAGLSTRISYGMINTYIKVINDLNNYTYEEIENMSKEEILKIIKKLGLSNARYKYISSMISFIEKNKESLQTLDIEQLINLIAKNVNGASYKVAQCCVLYMKGYYCGIMPVDSGMKDVQLPCLGFREYKGAIGHNILRKELEELIKENDLRDIIIKNGYENLNITNYKNATWWAHLVLIYYKRHYCNKHKPNECPLKDLLKSRNKCSR